MWYTISVHLEIIKNTISCTAQRPDLGLILFLCFVTSISIYARFLIHTQHMIANRHNELRLEIALVTDSTFFSSILFADRFAPDSWVLYNIFRVDS